MERNHTTLGQARQPEQRNTAVGTIRSNSAIGGTGAPVAAWESRLYSGLAVAGIDLDRRISLSDALGACGVEAEYVLALVDDFLAAEQPTRAVGEALILRLEAAAHRLVRVGTELEVAVQGYLEQLERGIPGIRETVGGSVWWPDEPHADLWRGVSLELRLRRCGYAFRHVAMSRLPEALESACAHLALVLCALRFLPPAGTVDPRALYVGLDELASGWQCDVAGCGRDDAPVLLGSIDRLITLDRSEDRSLDADIAWAHAQYATLAAARGRGDPRAATTASQHPEWSSWLSDEWRATICQLEALR